LGGFLLTAAGGFHYDLENSQDKFSNRVTKINCHGRLANDTAGQLKDVVKQRIAEGGRILIDLADVQHLDSSGLGTLVGLNAGYCTLELVNLSPRSADLLRITKLKQLFEG
jgi:anti-anti-sigma factor